MSKKFKGRYRIRRKSAGDRAWCPMAWSTNSRRKAQAEANLLKGEEHCAQVWDYKEKCRLHTGVTDN